MRGLITLVNDNHVDNFLKPFMPSGLFYFNSLDGSNSYIKGVWLFFIIIMFCRSF